MTRSGSRDPGRSDLRAAAQDGQLAALAHTGVELPGLALAAGGAIAVGAALTRRAGRTRDHVAGGSTEGAGSAPADPPGGHTDT